MTVCPSLTRAPSATLYRRSVPATGAGSFSPPVPVCAGAADCCAAGFEADAACAGAAAADEAVTGLADTGAAAGAF